jgi:hypothetical protein
MEFDQRCEVRRWYQSAAAMSIDRSINPYSLNAGVLIPQSVAGGFYGYSFRTTK